MTNYDDSLIRYTNNQDPYSYVSFTNETDFVSVGAVEPTDEELQAMARWEDVDGWTAY